MILATSQEHGFDLKLWSYCAVERLLNVLFVWVYMCVHMYICVSVCLCVHADLLVCGSQRTVSGVCPQVLFILCFSLSWDSSKLQRLAIESQRSACLHLPKSITDMFTDDPGIAGYRIPGSTCLYLPNTITDMLTDAHFALLFKVWVLGIKLCSFCF